MKIHDGKFGAAQIAREFDGVRDLWESSACHALNVGHNEAKLFQDGMGLHGWYGDGIKTVGDAKAILLNGWAAGAEKIRQHIASVEIERPEPPRRKPKWMADGDELNDDRAKMGLLDIAWRACPRTPTPNAMPIRVWVPVSASCNKTPEQIFWRGAAAAIAIDAMESVGFRVELWAYSQTTACHTLADGTDATALFAVKLKDADMPMSFDRLAIIAHAAFLRVAVFRAKLACGARAAYNLGYPNQPKPWGFMEDGDIVIPEHLFSKEAAEAWLKKMSESGVLPEIEAA